MRHLPIRFVSDDSCDVVKMGFLDSAGQVRTGLVMGRVSKSRVSGIEWSGSGFLSGIYLTYQI